MSTQGGFGVSVKIAVSSTLTAIAHVASGALPEFEKMVAEVTGHDAAGGYAEWLATGKRKVNQFALTLVWDPAESTHAALKAGFDSNDSVAMSFESPDGYEIVSFDALIVKLGRVSEQEGYYQCDVTIQPTGQPTVLEGGYS